MLDGEVINRCKHIGKKWQRRVLRQKLEKKARELIRRWITRSRWWSSFSKNLISIQERFIRGWATSEAEAAADRFFFTHPGVQRRISGRPKAPSFKATITDKDQSSAKITKEVKEKDKEETEQAGGGDRLG